MKINFKMPDQIFGIDTSLFKNFWLPAVLVIVFFITIKLIVMPKIDEINTVNNQAVEQEKRTSLLKEKIRYLTSLDKNELNKNADNLSSALLKEKNSYFLVNVIKGIADEFGFQIKSFSITPGELKGTDLDSIKSNVALKIPVSLVVDGPRKEYLNFVLALEKNLPILVIDKFDLSTIEGIAEIDMVVSSFYVRENLGNMVANLNLSDLTLKKEESNVLNTISAFTKSKEIQTEEIGTTKTFVKFNRENPFSF